MATTPQASKGAQPPFRAEHVGSLLRPSELKSAFILHQGGKMSPAAYDQIMNRAVQHAVKLQVNAGLQSITDGEFGRGSWFGFFFERMDGFRLEPSAFKFKDEHGGTYEWPTCMACARMHRRGSITGAEFSRLLGLTSGLPAVTAKMTMPAPSAFHFFRFHEPVDTNVYPDIATYWDDLVAVYQAELAELSRLGCTYVQLDEVPLAMLCDPTIRAQVIAMRGDPDALCDTYVRVLQRVLAGRPAGMTIGVHLCRGNFRSRWMAEGGYEPVAERLFNEVPADVYFLEYDSPRAGDFSPLRYVPKGKTVVLGLVSSKTARLEDGAILKRRLDEAAKVLALDQLALSPQCGFASVAGGNSLSEADEIAKLALIVKVAGEVWR
jgi:5-methyltetrahydropteroyltriglutamate--homocysteine methyltransferase